ncbi:MAG: HAMP domain-containing histidine kinase [Chloroflexi bacterium]|nr:HAMP domain-containing histidine kinase [Chloroflexota bacterium]
MTVSFNSPGSVDLVKNSARLIRMRWLAGLAVLTATPLCVYALRVPLPAQALYALGAVILAYNALLWWVSRRAAMRRLPWIAIGQFAFDWMALATFVHLTGGVESPAIWFFLFHVLLAPLLLPGRTTYVFAGLVIAAAGAVVVLEAAGALAHYRVLTALPPALYRDPIFIVALLGFFATTVIVSVGLMMPLVRELRERERQIAALFESIQALSSSLDLPQVLDQLARGVSRVLRARGASIRLLDDTGARLNIGAAYGLSQRYLEKGPVEVDRSPIDREALHGRPVIIEETAGEERLQYPEEIVAEGIHSILCVPLIGRRGPLGVLRVYGQTPRLFTAEQVNFVTAIARQGAAAIENAMSYGELRRAEEIKSQFVRAVTHELRSPVTASQSLLRTVTRDLAGGLNDLQREVLGRLSNRLDSLQLLIDDLLDLAAGKVEGLEAALAPVSIEAAVLSVIERVSAQAQEKTIDMEVNYVPRGLTVMASEDGLGRIFLNLIGNAVKYTPPGGRVRVTLEQCGDEAVVTVADTGMGVPEVDLPHLFEEFFRGSNVKQAGVTGTGLGLTIVKDLVDRYRGRISVTSKAGEGTTFTVTLPLAA